MSKTFLGFFVYLILFQVIIEVKSQNTDFKPLKRATHTATVIDNKLYILGGYNTTSAGTEEESGQQFFYLDVSKSFITQKLEWVDLTSINKVPPHKRAGSVRGGENNNTLFLFGGEPIAREMEIVYTFDTQSRSWAIPEIAGDRPLNKSGLFPVIGNNGKMYLFGGFLLNFGKANNYANDMAILDTVNLRWEQSGSVINAPTPRGYYGAVLLPNQKIIYIGKR